VTDAEKLGPEYFQDPRAVHERLREQRPVASVVMPDGMPAWLVTRYSDARAALADPRIIKDWRKLIPAGTETDWMSSAQAALSVHMLNTDPPDHERLRRLVNKAFTPRQVERLRPRVEAITASLLDAPPFATLPERGEVDLLGTFCFPLPVTVIGELLGVPAEDHDRFRAWSAMAVSSVGDPADYQAAALAMLEYFGALIAAKRAAPADDLLSALIQAQDAGDRLSETELLAMIFLLLVAGHETTVNLIASGTLTLLLNPDELARVAGDRSLLPGAVEELLRFVNPVNHATPRFAAEPVTIGGTEIGKGAVVVVALSGANHDPGKYEAPDRLDITRDTGGHMAFGHGIHYCVGAPLARMEAEIALGALLDRFPGMTLAVPESELLWRPSSLIHGLETLPVRLAG
jgi:cytochrome P450